MSDPSKNSRGGIGIKLILQESRLHTILENILLTQGRCSLLFGYESILTVRSVSIISSLAIHYAGFERRIALHEFHNTGSSSVRS
jgi:hypothetical protein